MAMLNNQMINVKQKKVTQLILVLVRPLTFRNSSGMLWEPFEFLHGVFWASAVSCWKSAGTLVCWSIELP